MKSFKELSAEVKGLEHDVRVEVPVEAPEDKGRQFQDRMAMGEEGPTFKSLLAEVKRLEKIIAASRYESESYSK